MQTYSYRAATAEGRVEAGRMESASAEAARSALAARALFPLEVRPEAAGARSLARVSTADLALGLRGLAVLPESGLGQILSRCIVLRPVSNVRCSRGMRRWIWALIYRPDSVSRMPVQRSCERQSDRLLRDQ